MSRPSKQDVFMGVAMQMAMLSTCPRRNVGCVLTDSQNRIIGSGYNGVPSGVPHCIDHGCGHQDSEHGSTCAATHAEVNALAQCSNVSDIRTVFTTSFPCFECFKLIMNTGCTNIVYLEPYPAGEQQVFNLNQGRIIFIHAAQPFHATNNMVSYFNIRSARPIDGQGLSFRYRDK